MKVKDIDITTPGAVGWAQIVCYLGRIVADSADALVAEFDLRAGELPSKGAENRGAR